MTTQTKERQLKLVELLVKELEEWPEGVTYFVQDGDGEVKAGSGSELSEPESSCVWIRHIPLEDYNFYSCLCTDWRTSIVTKDIYTKHKEDTQMKRKVRRDFDTAREYNVNVEECTEEEKKEVQQAFFDAGFPWSVGGKEYQRLDAEQYSNSLVGGDVTGYCMYGNTTNDCNMTAKEFLDLVYEPEKKGHVHAEIIRQYAEDAETTDKPWKNFQWRTRDSAWLAMQKDMQFESKYEFRRKPKPRIVNGVEVPVFEFTPKVGEEYYVADVGTPEFFEQWHKPSEDSTSTQRMIERGLIYPYTEEGKQAAILHSKAMLCIA
jgi:hypothetical protein